jgi:hypothetical protein
MGLLKIGLFKMAHLKIAGKSKNESDGHLNHSISSRDYWGACTRGQVHGPAAASETVGKVDAVLPIQTQTTGNTVAENSRSTKTRSTKTTVPTAWNTGNNHNSTHCHYQNITHNHNGTNLHHTSTTTTATSAPTSILESRHPSLNNDTSNNPSTNITNTKH